jgi:hypothetical protein
MTLQNYSFLWLNSKKALSGLQGGGREENVESIAAIIFERGRSQITELIIGEAFQPLCSFDRAYPGLGGVPLYESSSSEKVTKMKKDRDNIPVQQQ